MALPLPRGLSPAEIGFMCEMELVTVVPRQRLDSLALLGGPTPALRPPQRTDLPLWLALLLKRQKRADIVPPRWLHPAVLSRVLEREVNTSFYFTPSTALANSPSTGAVSTVTPPFQPANVTGNQTLRGAQAGQSSGQDESLPYHWLELSTLLLATASDDVPDAEPVRRLLRDLREVRLAKLRSIVKDLEPGGGVKLGGIGAIEVGEGRAFLGGVVDSLRKLGAAREAGLKERAEEEVETFGGSARMRADDDDDDVDML